MKICVSYLVDVCYVIIYTKKSRVNQNIETWLMPRSSASYSAYFFHPPRIWIRPPARSAYGSERLSLPAMPYSYAKEDSYMFSQ